MTAPDESGNGPVIRDNRRIDPVTGQPRRGKHAATSPAGTTGAGRPGPAGASGRHGRGNGKDSAGGEAVIDASEEPDTAPAVSSAAGKAGDSKASAKEGAAMEALRVQVAERTADVQRLQAEYANYRKRVERDRATVREFAVSSVLTELLPALDAIGIARDHGELSGGFKSVADQIQAAVVKLGLVTYGQKGDAFDPKIHEALTHTYSPDVAEDTCVEIFQPGYKVGERILRPARVAVAEPAGEDTD
ncbi:MAG TPA: nucleotide exchange factor GrpE [Streptosporangiaceae bacterium]|nr:nucleotide exchange factor GrpE [Streptosporangiaceae bacterium]